MISNLTHQRESRLAAHLMRRWGLDPNTPLGERMTEEIAAAFSAVAAYFAECHYREDSEELSAELFGIYAGLVQAPGAKARTLLPPECYQYYRFLTGRIGREALTGAVGPIRADRLVRIAREAGRLTEASEGELTAGCQSECQPKAASVRRSGGN